MVMVTTNTDQERVAEIVRARILEEVRARMAKQEAEAVPQVGMKRCSKCGQEKDVEAFAKNRSAKDGRQTWCRGCSKNPERDAAYYAANRERILKEKVEYFAKNKDKILPRTKEYGKTHRPQMRAYEAIYRDSHREQRRTGSAAHHDHRREHDFASYLLQATKRNANARHMTHTITRDDIQRLIDRQNGRCYWWGIRLVPSTGRRDPERPSLDRLDNSRGYEPDNVVLSCLGANLSRSSNSAERYQRFCDLLRTSFQQDHEAKLAQHSTKAETGEEAAE
jgi:hypothetical protein